MDLQPQPPDPTQYTDYSIMNTYATAASFFDVPSLRRVKPLPRSKRRRMGGDELDATASSSPHATLTTNPALSGSGALGAFPIPPYSTAFYPTFVSGSRSEEDTYDGGTNDTGGDDGQDSRDTDRDQQGNTKKRKVPAAAQHLRTISSSDNEMVGGDEREGREDYDRQERGSKNDGSVDAKEEGVVTPSRAKAKLSRAATAGMKLKEVMKSRKRLLSAVVGSLKPTETLALEMALAAPLQWDTRSPPEIREPYFRPQSQLGRRRVPPRMRGTLRCPLPAAEFTFTCPSSAGERMNLINTDAATYITRFTAELARLTAEAEATAKAGMAITTSDGKRNSGQRKKAAPPGNVTITPTYQSSEPGVPKISPGNVGPAELVSKKKKKKSGKASDPHQIRNYIPSRLPAGTGVPQPPTASQAALNLKNLISPHPVLFLSAEPKPRPRRNSAKIAPPPVTSSLPPVQPVDEWICSFCEYNLFYGDESGWRRAVRSRKSLLKRRRRARERAAAAASGQGKLLSTKTGSGEDEDGLPEEEQEARFEDPAEVDARVAATVTANKMRDKGGGVPVNAGT